MQFEFHATVDGIVCHIRTARNTLLPSETVEENAHKHFLMEFHCVFAGSETVYLPHTGRELRLTPGQILLVPTGMYHGVSTKGGTVERLCFYFSTDPASRQGSTLSRIAANIQDVLLFEDPDANALTQQCRRLQHRHAAPLVRTQQGMLLLNTVLQLLGSLPDARGTVSPEVSRTTRQRWIIEEYIELHFADSTGIEGLAKALYLSQRQTRKLVRQFLGDDYKSIIIRRRMELADILLRSTDRSLEEIAWQVGYRSYSGFQQRFKKHFGMIPSEKRNQLLETRP